MPFLSIVIILNTQSVPGSAFQTGSARVQALYGSFFKANHDFLPVSNDRADQKLRVIHQVVKHDLLIWRVGDGMGSDCFIFHVDDALYAPAPGKQLQLTAAQAVLFQINGLVWDLPLLEIAFRFLHVEITLVHIQLDAHQA